MRLALALLLAASACGPPERPDAPVDAEPADVGVDLIIGVVPLDILFVVDDSGRMQAHQPRLAAALGALDNRLGAGGARPTLHVGVASTDLESLVPTGDSLCNGPAPTTWLTTNQCPQIDRGSTYLIEERTPVLDGRTENYGGTFTDVLGCMVQLGHAGCGLEQPLEAMKRALGTPGFVRDLADLAVVILTDEDDCSISSPAFYSSDPMTSPLACFRHGVICDPDEPWELGAHAGCRPREDSMTEFPVQRYVDFLRFVKLAPTRVTIGIIAATSTDAVVEQSQDGPLDLAAQCQVALPDGTSLGYPAIRLGALAGAFGDDAVTATICEPELDGVLDAIGARAHREVRSTCLAARARPSCELILSAPGEPNLELPGCDATDGVGPCWRLRGDDTCEGAQQRLHVITEERPIPGTRVQGWCRPER